MAKLSLDLTLNARQAVKSADDFADALNDAADEFDRLAKESGQAESKVAADFRGMARDSRKYSNQVEKDWKGTFDGVADEASQSGREAAASFSGEFGDVQDFVQETLANAFAGLGPVGAAAGVALAAALGAALANATAAEERLQEAREAAADLSQTLYENNGKLPIEDAINRVLTLLPSERGAGNPFESLVNQFADLGTNLDAVATAARLANRPMSTFVRGLGGSDLDETRRSLDAVNQAIKDIGDAVDEGRSLGKPLIEVAKDEAQLVSLRDELQKTLKTSQLAREALGAVGSSFDSAQYVEEVRSLGEAWQDNATDASDYFTEAENGATKFDWESYLSNAERALSEANKYKRAIVGLPTDIAAEANRIFQAQGAGAANQYISAFTNANAANKQRFINTAKANGSAAGSAGGKALAEAANSAARARAQALGPIPVESRMYVNDWALRNYRPPTIYQDVILRPGQRAYG